MSSFTKNGMICFSELDIHLYDEVVKSRFYKHLQDFLELTSFIQFEYDITVEKQPKRRFLRFIWFDLYGMEVNLRIEINKKSPDIFQTLQFDHLCTYRKPTNRVYTDNYLPRNEIDFSAHVYR